MTIETAAYVAALNSSLPANTDPKSEGDDHLRLIKAVLLASFPNVTGAMSATHTELNYAVGVTSALAGVNQTATLTNKTLTSPAVNTPVITGGRETKVAMASNEIDLAAGNWFTKTITGDISLTTTTVPASGTVASFLLELTNAGAHTITWMSGMKWEGGIQPTWTSSGKDLIAVYTHDGGSTWNGIAVARNLA